MYVHYLGTAFQVAHQRLCDELIMLTNAGRYREAAALFIRVVQPVPAHTSEDAWEHCVHYNLALALGQAQRFDEARKHMDLSLLWAGGDTDAFIYPERARLGDQLQAQQEEAIARGVPSLLITSLPKSASAFISTALAEIQETPVFRAACSPDMKLGWVLSRWAAQLDRGGAVTHDHYPAENGNLQALAEAGVGRVYVQIRDPRAALWSNYHHELANALNSHRKVSTDALISTWYQAAVQWVEGWRRAAENSLGVRIEFITFDEVRSAPAETLSRLLADAGSTYGARDVDEYLARRATQGRKPENFRVGEPDDWRTHIPERVQAKMWDETPESVRDLLGMTKEQGAARSVIMPRRETAPEPPMPAPQPPEPAIVAPAAPTAPAMPVASRASAVPSATGGSTPVAPFGGWTHDGKDVRADWRFNGVSVAAFAGPAHALGSVGNPFEFMRSLYDKGADTIFMRDRHCAWYQRGVVGVGPSTASVVGFVKGLTGPNRRVVTLGNSMGGFAAILFGVLAGVDEVIAMAPQTFMDPENRAKHGITTFQEFINAQTWDASSPYLDLAKALTAYPASKTLIRIYHGARARDDGIYAQHLSHFPNVKITPVENCDHGEIGLKVGKLGVFETLMHR